MLTLYNQKVLSFKEVRWREKKSGGDEDDMVEDYYRIIA